MEGFKKEKGGRNKNRTCVCNAQKDVKNSEQEETYDEKEQKNNMKKKKRVRVANWSH